MPTVSALRSDQVRNVLGRIMETGPQRKAEADECFLRERAKRPGEDLSQAEIVEIYRDAPLSITAEVGELLHALIFASRPRLVVEFGSSFGVSTIFMAAAARDLGAGACRILTTELHPRKARLTRENLIEAGLEEQVELREGDALQTLSRLGEPVDVLFLDGLNRLYLPVLEMLEPQLAPGALVIADLSKGDPHQTAYQAHVRDPARGYSSVELALGDGVELTRRL